MAAQPSFADLELIERDACIDMYAAAPEGVRKALGLVCRPIDDGVLLVCRGIDHIQFNRLAAIGWREPARAETVARAIAEFEGAGVKNWIVQAPAQANGLAKACAQLGLQPHPRSWVKFQRPAAAIELPTRLSLREASASDAQAFAATAAAAFQMPPIVVDWLAALVARPRWHCFLAWDGALPVAAGAVFMDGQGAWLGLGGTLPTHRKLGAQSALLAARITRAAHLGCAWASTETGLPHPGEAGPSYHNIQRAGFATAYVRPNLTRKS
jgi:GNAT superfamily N-acetyltransferase